MIIRSLNFGTFSLFQVGHKPHGDDMVGNVNILSRKMGNVTIVQKGEDDIISDGDNGTQREMLSWIGYNVYDDAIAGFVSFFSFDLTEIFFQFYIY